ncbi:MAG: hypothetical protein E4G96_10135 [Chrysiogenales bacterium]|nr:MAG: hypothetical protein E4G96_10135 [Chrysiogenales bacterium]
MTIEIIDLIPDSRWGVIFKDEGAWRAGLYRPEFTRHEDITMMEKHTCPELFVCIGGRTGLLLKNGVEERVVTLEQNQALMVTDYHNGFSIDPEGYFLVIERTIFSTDYINRSTGAFIKRVDVKPEGPVT